MRCECFKCREMMRTGWYWINENGWLCSENQAEVIETDKCGLDERIEELRFMSNPAKVFMAEEVK